MARKQDLKVIEKELHVLYDKGGETNDYVGGYGGGHLQASSYEEVEQHERKRRQLATQAKAARAAVKQEKASIKEHVATLNDASSWTKKILDSDDRYVTADDSESRELAQATVGFVTAAAFKETRERLEQERQSRESTEASDAQKREPMSKAGPEWPASMHAPKRLIGQGWPRLGAARASSEAGEACSAPFWPHFGVLGFDTGGRGTRRRSEGRRRRRRDARRHPSCPSKTRMTSSLFPRGVHRLWFGSLYTRT